MMKKILTVIALIIILSSPASFAQDAQTFSSKVDESFKNSPPNGKFLGKQIDGTNLIYHWLIGNQGLQCLIGYTASEQTATKEYKNHNLGYSVGPKAQLKDLGDEAVLYQSKGSEVSTIIFRKSNVVVIVRAPTFAVAEGLAKQILGLIPNK